MDQFLVTLGLNEKQRKVYLACLQLGVAKARDIAAKVEIDRQSVYYVLHLLEKKGLISELIKGGVKHYVLVDTQTIAEGLDEEYKQKIEAIQGLKKMLKQLQNVHLERPKVEQYSGEEGFRTAVRDLLTEENSIIYAYSSDGIMMYSPTFLENFIAKRREKNIFMKGIIEHSEYIKKSLPYIKRDLRNLKFSDTLMGGKDFALAIAQDKLIFVRANAKDQYGFKIEDKEFCKLQREIFDIVWNQLN